MISNEVRVDREIAPVIAVVEERTIAFLRDNFDLVADGIHRRLRHEESLVLRSRTAIVGVGSRIGLYIAYSYDDLLIRAIAKRHTAGLLIAPEEQELYVQETAADVVNVIIGNSTADLAQRGELITLSPPVLMEGARTIRGCRGTTIAVLTLYFPEGALDVAFVGPSLMFDDHLNYLGANS